MKRVFCIVRNNRIRRMLAAATAAFVCLSAAIGGKAAVAAPAPGISVHAEAAALIDVTSGRILYSKEGDKRMPIASLTKIATAITAIEAGKLSDAVTVGKNSFGKEGSSIYLKLGEQISLNDLLYGLMLRSGNDAATAIAEHVGGSVEGFAYMMNQKATDLGLTNTHFTNPHGLDQAGHYSSANDMAKLTAYALHNPVFQEIVKTKVKRAPNPGEPWDRVWYNKNKMLSLYDGADGVKTGYTKIAKRCLVSSATRNGQQLAVVTLDDPDDWVDHARLLDYGFANFPLRTLVEKGEKVGEGIVAGNSLLYPVGLSETGAVSRKMELVESRSSAYRLGDRGKLVVSVDGNVAGSVPLYGAGSPQLAADKETSGLFTYERQSALTGFLNGLKEMVRALFTLPSADAGNA